MKNNSTIDSLSCIAFKFFGPAIRILPLNFSLFLGRRLGDCVYYLDLRHRVLVYANIRAAFAGKLAPKEISVIVKEFYRAYGQNLIEIFLMPVIDKEYLDKYMRLDGRGHIAEGFKRGKGIIFLSMHAGSWELSNIVCAGLGFPLNQFVREQVFPRLNALLNKYRVRQGCKLIHREEGLRPVIQALKNNEAIGITLDQGGRSGELVEFFGREASMATGAIKLALKYDAAIIPVFYQRIKGPYSRIIIDPVYDLVKTGNDQQDLQENLKRLVAVFERYITLYPKEYLWTYKIWKYGRKKNILILSDGKAGHLRQSQAVARITAAFLRDNGMISDIQTLELKFKSGFSKVALQLGSLLSGKYHCQGCLWCLRNFLTKETCQSLSTVRPDMIISCGAALAPVNYCLSREAQGKSVVVMRPGLLSLRKFDLVIMPRHDSPPQRKNVVVTEGALNLIDEEYLKEQSGKLTPSSQLPTPDLYIGLLIGGDSKKFALGKDNILEVIRQIKITAEKLDAGILVTTSRRTSQEAESLIKAEFTDYARCKLLIIANEKNIPEAVGGILGLSRIIVVSPESISMISEAASSKKYVFVFKGNGLNKRHREFLRHFAGNKYIYLGLPDNLSGQIQGVWSQKPKVYSLRDNSLVREAIGRTL